MSKKDQLHLVRRTNDRTTIRNLIGHGSIDDSLNIWCPCRLVVWCAGAKLAGHLTRYPMCYSSRGSFCINLTSTVFRELHVHTEAAFFSLRRDLRQVIKKERG